MCTFVFKKWRKPKIFVVKKMTNFPIFVQPMYNWKKEEENIECIRLVIEFKMFMNLSYFWIYVLFK